MTSTAIQKLFLRDTLLRDISIIITMYAGISFSSNELILTNEIYFDYYKDQIESTRIDEVISKTRSFNKLKAIWEPISNVLSILGTALCLSIGCMYHNQKVKFRQLFNISLIAYFIFFIPVVIKFLYFQLSDDASIPSYNSYSFGSLIFLTSVDDPFWLKSILQAFTLFELLYWILLAVGLSTILNWDFDRALKLVISSYVVGLIFWITAKIYVKMVLFNLN